ncbi:hypothetical protein CMV30_07880 [Nibricoccus aquaticus]|uniref:Alpha-galactosidase NEW3 domain-containing protein n=1 Tax=Nibricoccus aquaticus TaxID=2576891 RepID=A0A290QJ11_9BACT|nr:carboxypeptidase-like regulatory domain-containing protein [Nibricoccus aquaticus]ATC63872.1 hypothetical protein CMV30_07880 [Nibricoccus aquaticus]
MIAHSRSLLALAALVAGLAGPRLLAETTLAVRSGQSATIAPGGFFSATVALRDSSASSPGPLLREHLQLPPGWTDLSPAGLAFSLTGPEQIRFIAVAIPRTTAAGDYTLIYSVGPETDPALEQARAELTITVPAVTTLRIENENAPAQLVAGDRLTAVWRVTNQSNHPAALLLKARSSLDLPVTLAPSSPLLQPGESILVTATATTPAQLRGEQTHQLLLDAQLAGDAKNSRQVVAAHTRLFPRFTTAAQADSDFRLSLRTTAVQRKFRSREASGLQSELSGNGFIDPERTRRIDFLLRTDPVVSGPSRVLPRSRYSFSYRSPALDLLLGDNQFSLSPLTQRSLSGRGAGVTYRAPPSAAGLYYADTPWQTPDTHQLGAFAQLDASPSARLRTNLLVRDTAALASSTETRSVLPSFQVFLKPDESTSLEAEAALSDNRAAPTGDAWRLRLRGNRGDDFNYDLEHLRASPDFFGYYQDVRSTSGNAWWKLSPDWQAHGSFLSSRYNLDRSPAKISAPQTDTATTGLDRKISDRLYLSADYAFTDTRDRLPSRLPGFSQNALALAANVNTRFASFRTTVEEGSRHLRSRVPQTDRFTYVSLFSVFRPRLGGTYSLYLGTGDSRYTAGQRETTASATGQWALTESLRAYAAYSSTEYRGTTRQSQSSVEASLGYEFPGGSSLDLNLRASSYNHTQQDRTVSLSYRVPLPTPSLARRDSASLSGKVLLRSADATQPLPRVILRLGKLPAATDQHGRFVFPSVRPGRHELTIDPLSLGMNVVLAHSAPIIVELERGKRAELAIDAAPAARLDGEILRYEAPPAAPSLAPLPAPDYRPAEPLRNITIELRRPGERVRSVTTDAQGRFGFDRLPPGDWTLSIDDRQLPAHHRLADLHSGQNELPITLTAAATQQIHLRVLPAARPMRLLDDAWLPTTR